MKTRVLRVGSAGAVLLIAAIVARRSPEAPFPAASQRPRSDVTSPSTPEGVTNSATPPHPGTRAPSAATAAAVRPQRGAIVRGRVRTEAGAPVAGAWVQGLRRSSTFATTDAEGRFSLPENPDGAIVIRASGWGTTLSSSPAPGQAEADIVVRATGSLRLHSRDGGAARLVPWRLDLVEGSLRVPASSGSHPEIRRLSPGAYELRIEGEPSRFVRVHSGAEATVELGGR